MPLIGFAWGRSYGALPCEDAHVKASNDLPEALGRGRDPESHGSRLYRHVVVGQRLRRGPRAGVAHGGLQRAAQRLLRRCPCSHPVLLRRLPARRRGVARWELPLRQGRGDREHLRRRDEAPRAAGLLRRVGSRLLSRHGAALGRSVDPGRPASRRGGLPRRERRGQPASVLVADALGAVPAELRPPDAHRRRLPAPAAGADGQPPASAVRLLRRRGPPHGLGGFDPRRRAPQRSGQLHDVHRLRVDLVDAGARVGGVPPQRHLRGVGGAGPAVHPDRLARARAALELDGPVARTGRRQPGDPAQLEPVPRPGVPAQVLGRPRGRQRFRRAADAQRAAGRTDPGQGHVRDPPPALAGRRVGRLRDSEHAQGQDQRPQRPEPELRAPGPGQRPRARAGGSRQPVQDRLHRLERHAQRGAFLRRVEHLRVVAGLGDGREPGLGAGLPGAAGLHRRPAARRAGVRRRGRRHAGVPTSACGERSSRPRAWPPSGPRRTPATPSSSRCVERRPMPPRAPASGSASSVASTTTVSIRRVRT